MDWRTVKTYSPSFHGQRKANSNMQYRQLGNTDMVLSHLGLGTSALGSVYGPINEGEAYDIVEMTLQAGVNYIDTAPWYGHGKSEQVLGEAFRHKNIPRAAYYIGTKVGRYDPEPSKMFDFSYDRTVASVKKSLDLLGLEYVDVIQAHDVEFAPSIDVVLKETLPALQKMKEEGKARYIGVTGYPLSVLKEVVMRSKIKIDTILTYCRYTLNDTSFLDYQQFFSSRGIGIINASPHSMGLLTNNTPPEWHPALLYTPQIANTCKEAVEYCRTQGVDISRLSLYFSLEQKSCTTCLVSTAIKEYAQKNLNLISDSLSDKEMEVMQYVRDKFMKPLNNSNWEEFERAALMKGEFVG